MADEVKTAPAAAPAAAPAVAPAAQTQPPKNPEVRRSPVITNPAPVIDPNAPVVEKKVDESNLSPSTLAEMEAGRKALGKNAPAKA